VKFYTLAHVSRYGPLFTGLWRVTLPSDSFWIGEVGFFPSLVALFSRLFSPTQVPSFLPESPPFSGLPSFSSRKTSLFSANGPPEADEPFSLHEAPLPSFWTLKNSRLEIEAAPATDGMQELLTLYFIGPQRHAPFPRPRPELGTPVPLFSGLKVHRRAVSRPYSSSRPWHLTLFGRSPPANLSQRTLETAPLKGWANRGRRPAFLLFPSPP